MLDGVEITSLGFIWLPLLIAVLFLPLRYAAGMVIIGSIFHAASVINIADKGVGPFFLAELFFLLRGVVNIKKIMFPLWVLVLLVLVLYVTYSVFFFPDFFAGTTVFLPEKGLDASISQGGEPLKRTLSQWIQLLYFLCNAMTLFMFYLHRKQIGGGYVYHVFCMAMLVVAVTGLWEFAAGLGWFYFPYEFFYSNPGYAQLAQATAFGVDRLNSTFSEPSFAAGVLAAAFWMFVVAGNPWLAVPVFLAFLLTLSGTGFLAFMFGWLITFRQNKTFFLILFVVLLVLVLVYLSGFFIYFENLILDKLSGDSAVIRLAADAFTGNVLVETLGFGGGLGSHRPSSLISYLLGNIGVIGFLLFSGFLLLFLYGGKRLPVNSRQWDRSGFVRYYIVVLLVALAGGIPDVNFPSFWAALFVMAVVTINSVDDMLIGTLVQKRP